MGNIGVIILLYLHTIMLQKANAVSCYDCRADDNTCNVGECHGSSCIKMETSNMDNGRKTVYKSCSDEYEDTQCKQSGFGSKLISRCACETNFCNGDKNLVAAGLQTSSKSNKNLPLCTIIFLCAIISTIFQTRTYS